MQQLFPLLDETILLGVDPVPEVDDDPTPVFDAAAPARGAVDPPTPPEP